MAYLGFQVLGCIGPVEATIEDRPAGVAGAPTATAERNSQADRMHREETPAEVLLEEVPSCCACPAQTCYAQPSLVADKPAAEQSVEPSAVDGLVAAASTVVAPSAAGPFVAGMPWLLVVVAAGQSPAEPPESELRVGSVASHALSPLWPRQDQFPEILPSYVQH